ncbi:TPA: AAA family ATPase [Vibrio vulnificus]
MISELKLRNVGPIKEATVPIKDLTIICGRNGVGKTYLSYSYFMFMDNFRKLLFHRVTLSKEILKSISETASATGPSRKSFDLKMDELGLSYRELSELLKIAADNEEIFSTLEISKAHSSLISGGIDESTYRAFISKPGKLGFDGSLDIFLSKEKDEDTIKVTLIRDHEDELDADDIYTDVKFIVGVFIVDHIAKLGQFPITSERTGISLFFEELIEKRRDIKRSSNESYNYPMPIETNISNMRMIKSRKYAYNHWIHKRKRSFQSQVANMLGGTYKLENDGLYFQPKGKDILVPLRVSSGASKSLMLLDYFIHNFDSYGTLIIDEPELNLHLDNQKEIARVICSIANMGIKVIVTTHSDHFVREVNNLIMLSSPKLTEHHKQDIMKKARIHRQSIINPEQVSTVVLSSKEQKSFEMPVSEYGIDLKLFNDEIMANNDISNELMMAIYEGSNA